MAYYQGEKVLFSPNVRINPVGRRTEDGGEIFNDYENNKAEAKNTSAFGTGTVASTEGQRVSGTFNIVDNESKYLDIVGNGTSDDNRSNAYTLDKEGNAWFAKSVEAPTVYTNQVVLLSPNNIKFALKVKDNGTLYTEEVQE